MPKAADGPKSFSYVGGPPLSKRYSVLPRSGEAMDSDVRRRREEAKEHEKDVGFLNAHPRTLLSFDSIREARLHHEQEQKRRREALSRSTKT